MTRREFLYSGAKIGLMSQNPRHNFALNHTMLIYGSGACCTWIPKNACSTLRFSVAKANGCISDLSDIHWIHSNNRTFNATTQTAFNAPYTFVVLRCPYARLVSAFLNKFVDLDVQAWAFSNMVDRTIHPHDLTFRTLLQRLRDIPMPRLDIHLRQQSDFLLFRRYDDYFALEDFAKAINTIEEKAKLPVQDTREALGHDVGQLVTSDDFKSPMDIPAAELLM